MCFEKPLLWWLLETHMAFRRLGEGSIMTNQYAHVVLIGHNECGGNGCCNTYNEMVFICLTCLMLTFPLV